MKKKRIFSSVPDKFLPVTLLRLSVSAFYFQNIPTVEELFLIRCYVIKLFSTEILNSVEFELKYYRIENSYEKMKLR